MDLGLRGRRAAVAAGSRGLGLAAAQALAAEGARVVLCSRDAERARAAADATVGDVTGIAADVASPAGAERFVGDAAELLGGVDILVTNAGGPPPSTFATTAFEAYLAAISSNLLSVVAMCRATVPDMRRQGWGRVVAITSITVRQPIPNLITSTTARAGATGFLKSLATEVAADGVTVNSLQPGYHSTARVTAVAGDDLAQLAASIPVGDLGRPDDFGAIVAFLCSNHARFVTGTALPVDGGASMGLQ